MKLAKTLALAALLLPSAALAQARPRYEFGVDANVAYTMPSEGANAFSIGIPFDVRIGILNPGPLSFEPRFALGYRSTDDRSSAIFTPGVNVLYQAGKRALLQRGMYFTAGLALDYRRETVEDATGDDVTASNTDPVINFGIGTRTSINQGAFRPEGYIAYGFDSEAFQIGGRFGVSFWK